MKIYPNDRDPETKAVTKRFRLASTCAECRCDWVVQIPSAETGRIEVSPDIARSFPPCFITLSFHLDEAPSADSFSWRPDGETEWRRVGDGSYVRFEVPAHTRIDILAKRQGCKPILETVEPLCYGADYVKELLSWEQDPWPHPDTETWSNWQAWMVPRGSIHMTWDRLYDKLQELCNTQMPADEFFQWLCKADRNSSLRRQRDTFRKKVEAGEEPAGIYVEVETTIYYPGSILFPEPPEPEPTSAAAVPAAEPAAEAAAAEPTAEAAAAEPAAEAAAAEPTAETSATEPAAEAVAAEPTAEAAAEPAATEAAPAEDTPSEPSPSASAEGESTPAEPQNNP